MDKKLQFTSIQQILDYCKTRFPADVAFSRMNAEQKAYATFAGIASSGATLSQLKAFLSDKREALGLAGGATRERIYRFFADRIVDEEQEINELYERAKADEVKAFVD